MCVEATASTLPLRGHRQSARPRSQSEWALERAELLLPRLLQTVDLCPAAVLSLKTSLSVAVVDGQGLSPVGFGSRDNNHRIKIMDHDVLHARLPTIFPKIERVTTTLGHLP